MQNYLNCSEFKVRDEGGRLIFSYVNFTLGLMHTSYSKWQVDRKVVSKTEAPDAKLVVKIKISNCIISYGKTQGVFEESIVMW